MKFERNKSIGDTVFNFLDTLDNVLIFTSPTSEFPIDGFELYRYWLKYG